MSVEGAPLHSSQLTGDDAILYQHVLDLTIPSQRESALLELSKRRESNPDLALLLWHSPGAITALLHELVSVYPYLSPPSLTPAASNKVCNSLALLQSVASHAETRHLFIDAHIPLFLYPFLNTIAKTRPFEYLRLTSLGVIGGLVKMDDPSVISFLLQTEIIPLCLRIMETGTELSKTVATFVVQKILLDEAGLAYVCLTPERFYAVSLVLSAMVRNLIEQPSGRLLKHVIRCFLRLTDNEKSRTALRSCLPPALRTSEFSSIALRDDSVTRKWLQELLERVPLDENVPPPPQQTQDHHPGQMMMGGGGMLGMPPPQQQQQLPPLAPTQLQYPGVQQPQPPYY